jgi:formylglycine-generating enzyme required for sulfatase activity
MTPVGRATLGAAFYGQLDLAGDIEQWTLDTYADYVNPCVDCANLSGGAPPRVLRGGSAGSDEASFYPANRDNAPPGSRVGGIRCARRFLPPAHP